MEATRSRRALAVAALGALVGLSILTVLVHDRGSSLSVLDNHLSGRTLFPGEGARGLMTWITRIGDPQSILLILGLLVTATAVRRRIDAAVFCVSTFALSSLAVRIMKETIERARPEPGQLLHASFSFPSGHAAAGLTAGLTLAALLLIWGVPRARILSLLAVVLGLAVGYSRVYLSVHWLSDVLAGWCVSTATVSIVTAVFLRRLSDCPQAAVLNGDHRTEDHHRQTQRD